MLFDVTDVWQHDLVTLILVLRIERKINWKENKKETAFSFDKYHISWFQLYYQFF